MSMLCSFCRTNGEQEAYFKSHNLKDENNHVTCPILLQYVCPLCNVKGRHTLSYCPLRKGGKPAERKKIPTPSRAPPIRPTVRTSIRALPHQQPQHRRLQQPQLQPQQEQQQQPRKMHPGEDLFRKLAEIAERIINQYLAEMGY